MTTVSDYMRRQPVRHALALATVILVLPQCRHQDAPSPAAASPLSSAEPPTAPAPAATPPAFAPAPDYAAHVEALRRRLPAGTDFTILVEAPFVVIGDGEPAAVRRHAEHTVRWAVRHLKAAFFARDPARILDIWLFQDDRSYRRFAKELFGDTPDTPYGYYSAAHGALIMNIGTGGGTLVHEIVHPYIAANFPGCPAWFNEGLGSLFEQSDERNGAIVGLTNWRLHGLQQAIRAHRAPKLSALLRTSSGEFYGADSGLHYATARYLLYWLQQHGKLTAFYRAFQAGRVQDPSGAVFLRAAIGVDDLDAWQPDFEAFVLQLRYP